MDVEDGQYYACYQPREEAQHEAEEPKPLSHNGGWGLLSLPTFPNKPHQPRHCSKQQPIHDEWGN